MNKKLVAVAIAGLLAAPLAQAQTANVTLYGRLNMDVEVVSGRILTPGVAQPATCTGAITSAGLGTCITANPSQFRVSSNSSRFGLRGTESLGGGLNAIFQVENSVAADNGGNQAANNRQLANRDTFLGLQGSFGTFKMGFFHLPYDNIGTIWGDNPTLETSILNQGTWAQSFAAKATGSFDDRVGNTVRWDSPVMSGWQGQLSYSIGGSSPNAAVLSTQVNEAGAPKSSSSVTSGIIMYNSGPIMFGAGFQTNQSVRAKNLNDRAYSVAGSYQFPMVRVGGVWERLKYECAAGVAALTACTPASAVGATAGTTDLKRNFWGVDVTIDVGPGQFYVQASRAEKGTGSAPDGARVSGLAKGPDTASDHWMVSYTYPLSTRTKVFTGYTRINNQALAAYNFGVNSYGVVNGGKPSGFALGMWHNF